MILFLAPDKSVFLADKLQKTKSIIKNTDISPDESIAVQHIEWDGARKNQSALHSQ